MNKPFSVHISQYSFPEKIQLVEDLWDDIASQPETLPVPQWQKVELERRKAAYKRNPHSAASWEEVKKSILG
jgi:putative addiction module component (TIGR02574 family)